MMSEFKERGEEYILVMKGKGVSYSWLFRYNEYYFKEVRCDIFFRNSSVVGDASTMLN